MIGTSNTKVIKYFSLIKFLEKLEIRNIFKGILSVSKICGFKKPIIEKANPFLQELRWSRWRRTRRTLARCPREPADTECALECVYRLSKSNTISHGFHWKDEKNLSFFTSSWSVEKGRLHSHKVLRKRVFQLHLDSKCQVWRDVGHCQQIRRADKEMPVKCVQRKTYANKEFIHKKNRKILK